MADKTIKILVTEEDWHKAKAILKGNTEGKARSQVCVIAQSLNRHGMLEVIVGHTYATIKDEDGKDTYWMGDKKFYQVVRAFDRSHFPDLKKLLPCELTLTKMKVMTPVRQELMTAPKVYSTAEDPVEEQFYTLYMLEKQ